MLKTKRFRLNERNTIIIALFLITLIGYFLRVYNLGQHSLWYDEVLSVFRAQASITETFRIWFPHPLQYMFTRIALYFGKSDFAIRFPSVIFGILAIPLIYQVGKELFGREVGIVSALFLSVSPFHIYYSQDARYYPYLMFFSLLTLYFFWKCLKEEKKRWWVAGFIISTFFNLLIHPIAYAVLLTEVICLFLLLLIDIKFVKAYFLKKYTSLNRRHGIFLLLGVTGLVVILIFLIFRFYPLIDLQIRVKPTTQIRLGEAYGISHPSSTHLQSWKTIVIYTIGNLGAGEGIAFYLFFSLFLLGLIASTIRYRKQIILLFLWMVLPFIYLFTINPYPRFEMRYFVFLLPVYLIVVSQGIINSANISTRFFFGRLENLKIKVICHRLWIFTLLVVILVFSTRLIYYKIKIHAKNYNWKAVARYMEKAIKPGDIIFCRHIMSYLQFFYYYNTPENQDQKEELIRLISKKRYGNTRIFSDKITDEFSTIWFKEAIETTSNLRIRVVSTGLLHRLSTEEYQKWLSVMRPGRALWFLSIPNYKNTIFAPMAKEKGIKSIGGVHIYQLDLLETHPLGLAGDREGIWRYTDDYSSMRYIREAYNVQNLYGGVGSLYPSSYNRIGSIIYKFCFPYSLQSFKIKPSMWVSRSNNYLKVYVSPDGLNYTLLRTFQNTDSISPDIEGTNLLKGPPPAFIKIEMYTSSGKLYDSRLEKLEITGKLSPERRQPRYIIPAFYKNIYSDNFDNNTINNYLWKTAGKGFSPTWTHDPVNKWLNIHAPDNSSLSLRRKINLFLTEGVFQIKFYITELYPNDGCTSIAIYSGKNYYQFVHPPGCYSSTLMKIVNGNQKISEERMGNGEYFSEDNYTKGQWHTMTLFFSRKELRGYLDGVEVLSGYDYTEEEIPIDEIEITFDQEDVYLSEIQISGRSNKNK